MATSQIVSIVLIAIILYLSYFVIDYIDHRESIIATNPVSTNIWVGKIHSFY